MQEASAQAREEDRWAAREEDAEGLASTLQEARAEEAKGEETGWAREEAVEEARQAESLAKEGSEEGQMVAKWAAGSGWDW